jgi:flagella basal body P-ring formation protein FlgA
MTFRALHLATTLAAALLASGPAYAGDDVIAAPVLRGNVTVTGDIVRIGDLIDNAGSFAEVPVYRAPDLGTTGQLSTAQVINALRAHQVIGVETRDIKQISVTRLARSVASKDLELAVAHAIEHRSGLGDAANLSLTFDRELQDLRLDASFTGAIAPTAVRVEPRNGRFDVTLEIASEDAPTPTRLRFTGTAIETVEAAVLTRNVERTDLLKSSDIVVERRTKAEVGGDAATREGALGMQLRRPMRAGQPIRVADLAKPDLVQRDQAVTVVYQAPGLYLTTRGKALDNGTEGDVVNVLNLQSKRTLTGVVTGRGQVTIQTTTIQTATAQATAPKSDPDYTSSITPDASAPVSPVGTQSIAKPE